MAEESILREFRRARTGRGAQMWSIADSRLYGAQFAGRAPVSISAGSSVLTCNDEPLPGPLTSSPRVERASVVSLHGGVACGARWAGVGRHTPAHAAHTGLCRGRSQHPRLAAPSAHVTPATRGADRRAPPATASTRMPALRSTVTGLVCREGWGLPGGLGELSTAPGTTAPAATSHPDPPPRRGHVHSGHGQVRLDI